MRVGIVRICVRANYDIQYTHAIPNMIPPTFFLTNGIHATDHKDKNPSGSGNSEDKDTKDSAGM